MTQTTPASETRETRIAFNLWDEPWIGVILPDGILQQVSILDCLRWAHEFRALYDSSPLVVAGTHRLLAATVQDIYRPRWMADIAALLERGRFDSERIAAYAEEYRAHFDLFSEDAPFLQTADVPLFPKDSEGAPVSRLFFEEPSGTKIIHFQHIYEDEHSVCSACAARGLVTRATFEIPDGAGYKTSINGAPPIFVFPIGANLFETLTLALITPGYQPHVRDTERDRPAWALSTPIVGKSEEVLGVGYLESLTFPTRRMRLYPQIKEGTCTRCGRASSVLVSKMNLEMGKFRPGSAPWWQDPFAAYRQQSDKEPVPLRPQEGKALWREYGTLFLSSAGARADSKVKMLSPSAVSQLSDLEGQGGIAEGQLLRFRCIGIRTDMKAKIFEWVDEALEVPAGLLREPKSAREVGLGIERAEECERDIKTLFRRHFRPDQQGKRERFQGLRERMSATYWTELSAPFRAFVLSSSDPDQLDEVSARWVETITRAALAAFVEAVEGVGERGSDLRKRVEAVEACRIRMATRRKEWI